MKILIADILLKGREHSDWKEGYEFKYAFENLGHQADVYGFESEFCETLIPEVSNEYDFALITENYPGASAWKWWNWKEIKIPKIFWAIDTHLVNYLPWITENNIDIVAFNNKVDIEKYNLPNSFWLPYFASKKHFDVIHTTEKVRDVAFIGGMTPRREYLCNKFNITPMNAFGDNYVKEMQSSKICFNESISYDINAKYFQIISSGTFMLTNTNENLLEFFNYNSDISKMFYKNEDELGEKIKYYLENDKERECIAKRAKDYIFTFHSGEKRAQLILEKFNQFIKK